MKHILLSLTLVFLFLTHGSAQTSWHSPFLQRSGADKDVYDTYSSISVAKPLKILIARPVSKYGDVPLENKWILLLCEYLLYFRLSGIESISVIDKETLTELLPEYMEYKQPISFEMYDQAARKTGADYLLYVQCEYHRLINEGQVSLGRGTDVNFFGKIIAPGSSTPLFSDAKQFPVRKLGMRLDTFLAGVLQAAQVPLTEKNRNFLSTAVLSQSDGKIRKVGAALEAVYNSQVVEWDKFFKSYTTLLRRNNDMLLGYYAGAFMCETSGHYAEGARLFQSLTDLLDLAYPLSFLECSRLYRLCGKYEQAETVLESMPPVSWLRHDVRMEQAYIRESQGDIVGAADIVMEVLREDYSNKKARAFYKQKPPPLEDLLPQTVPSADTDTLESDDPYSF
jgi:hypothetical protein